MKVISAESKCKQCGGIDGIRSCVRIIEHSFFIGDHGEHTKNK